MELKQYQQKTIEKLKEYLEKTKTLKGDHETAFLSIMNKESENGVKYNDFFGVPAVCVKIPTGGGKTLVATHNIEEIMNNYLQEKLDKGIIIWFTPSDEIKSQTLKKLKDKKDMHRQTLDNAFENNIKIFSNEEALRIRKHDVEDNLCIIVASLDAFRKDSKLRNKYKVYQENGELLPFFEENIDDSGLEKDETGVITSLANVIRLYAPLIVIDEGHRTKTKISIDFLKDLNPSFVIEYTATPREGSNILVNIHSQELKNEQMVKIPIVLESKRDWKEVIDDGFVQRQTLEEITKHQKEPVRPIALYQAEADRKHKDNITVEKIKDYLMKEKKVHEAEIAIKISGKNELSGIDLFSKKCKIRHIITINALAEGWDCSFAYVLVSVANLGSKIAVEQIIGRIIRMPFAEKRTDENLNKSYVFASAKNFQDAADQIIKGLEDNGYSRNDLISITQKEQADPFKAKKRFKEELKIPVFAFEGEKLSFGEHLLGEEFELSKQDHKLKFILPLSEDGKGEIDITEEGDWKKGTVKQLRLSYGKKEQNTSENKLTVWLDDKIRLKEIERKDKLIYINKILKEQLKEHTLRTLSLNRYPLKEAIEKKITKIIQDYAEKQFEKYASNGKITLKEFEPFPDEIELADEINQDYKKSYYDKIGKLNKEEKSLIDKLDLDELSNIRFWVRCREKQQDAFALQGWKRNKFYPDFAALTNNGTIIGLEWKGEDRLQSEDTLYKEALGEQWDKLGKGKTSFFLVSKLNVEETLKKIKEL